MAYTFDTAWIIAQMIRTRSEAQKRLAERRLDRLRDHMRSDAYWQHEYFETFCWAWKHGALAHPLPAPSHDPYPYYEPRRS